MSAQAIIQTLNELIFHYKHINEMAKEKTNIVKNNKIEALQKIIKEENKLIRTIRKLEGALMKETRSFLLEKGVSTEEPTISKMIEVAEDYEKEALLERKNVLENELKELKRQNDLNQQLLEQSLQFVEMSLDLLNPDIDAYNYDPSNIAEQERERLNISFFDSKV